MVKLLKFGKKGIITFLVAALAMVFASGAMAEEIKTEEALRVAAAEGGSHTLGNSIIISNDSVVVSKDMTLDLKGYSLTKTDASTTIAKHILVVDKATLTINDTTSGGKMEAKPTSTGEQLARVISIKNGGKVILNGGEYIGEGKYAHGIDVGENGTLIINAATISADSYGVFVQKNSTLTVKGGTITTGSSGYGISGNGNGNYNGTSITISGGKIIGGNEISDKDAGAAVYHPQEGILTITGGEFSGYNGIQFKGGTLNMSGGTITATGELTKDAPEDSSNGCVITGAALSLITNKSYAGNISARISGSAKLISEKANAVFERKTLGSLTQVISVDISEGTFQAAASKDALLFENWGGITNAQITGGTYSSDPSAYVESPYVVKQVEGKYVVALAGVAITPTAAELVLGLTPTAKLTASSDIEEDFTWASKNDDVVTVDKSGNITAVGAGTADVTATGDSSKSVGTCVVTVRAATPVSVTPSKMELNIGATGKATAKYDAKDSITWESSDTAVATVKDGTVTAVKAGIAVITAKGSKTSAACTVTVTDPAAPDPVTPTPAPVDAGTVDKENNPVNKEEGKPENVEAATPAITEATEEGKAAVVSATKIEEKNLVATADGKLTISPVLAKSALEEVISADATVAPKNVVLLPIVQAAVTANNVAALAFTMTGEQLGAEENTVAGDVKVIKVLADGKGGQFSYASAAADYADKTFTLKDADGKSLALTDKVAKASTYALVIFVADNGDFDLDATAGSVIDPVAVATNAATEPKSGGSSSGCNGGFGALALLAFAVLPFIRREKR